MLKVVKIMKGNLCCFTTFFVLEHVEQIFNSEKNEEEKTASASAIATITKMLMRKITIVK